MDITLNIVLILSLFSVSFGLGERTLDCGIRVLINWFIKWTTAWLTELVARMGSCHPYIFLLKTSYYTLCEMILKQKGNLNQITVVSLRSTTKRLITGILQMILQKRDHFKLIWKCQQLKKTSTGMKIKLISNNEMVRRVSCRGGGGYKFKTKGETLSSRIWLLFSTGLNYTFCCLLNEVIGIL